MFKKIVWLWFSTKGKKAKDVEKYIKSLVDGWANEFFTWYNPDYWSDVFGFEVSPNGRFAEHEQITDFETLQEIVKEVHKYGLEVFINLNAWYYTDETWPYILRMLSEFDEVWVDGIICGNITILEYLSESNYKWKINISTILAAYNTQAIAFYLDNYTINKVILSREITLKEIEYLVTSFPNTNFEVFWEWDFCRYNNGLCFAEHKYGAKDICTLVLNDLIIKKKFHPDFKQLILNDEISDLQKIETLDDGYENIFQELDNLLTNIELFDKKSDYEQIEKIIQKSRNRVDLFFDSMQNIQSDHNNNILTYLKALKKLWNTEYQNLQQEIEHSVETWVKQLMLSVKKTGYPQLKAKEIANLYAKGDSLNLYTYIFFSQFKNIETVKFPTRWRNYNEKIQMIQEVVEAWKVDKDYLSRDISIQRTHYDLNYLFGEKLWFRKMIQEMN